MPSYELTLSDGKWLLRRTKNSSVVAEFRNQADAQRALFLFERSEQQTKSLIDSEAAKKEFDKAFATAKGQANIVSGYDHQLD